MKIMNEHMLNRNLTMTKVWNNWKHVRVKSLWGFNFLWYGNKKCPSYGMSQDSSYVMWQNQFCFPELLEKQITGKFVDA